MKFRTEKEKWVWLAGLVEGEGCLGLYYKPKTSYRKTPYWDARLTITNTSPLLIKTLKQLFGGWASTMKRPLKYRHKWRLLYQWVIAGKKLRKVLLKIRPYSLIKSKHIKLLLKIKSRKIKKGDKKIFQQIKQLNKRGKEIIRLNRN